MLKEKGVPFFPDSGWRDVVFGTGVILLLVILAIFVGAPELVGPPDPSNVDVKPHPDWYLMWPEALYALMPYNIESYVMFLMPVILFGLLFAVPFISLGGQRAPLRRPWAIAGVIGVLASIISLTYMGIKAPWSPDFNTQQLSDSEVNAPTQEALHGYQLFYDKGCQYCHQVEGKGGIRGPNLTKVGERLTPEEMTIRIVNGGHNMPAFGGSLSHDELNAIVAFLQSRKVTSNDKVPTAQSE